MTVNAGFPIGYEIPGLEVYSGAIDAIWFRSEKGTLYGISILLLGSKWSLQMLPFISVGGCNCRMPG